MIPATLRANFSYLLRHPLQLALALLGIGIGVAVIVAVDLANSSARKAFLLSMDAVTGEATHQVIGGPRGIDESVYVRLRVAEGIRTIAPIVEGTVSVNETSFTLIGVDLFAEQEMRAFSGQAKTAGGDDAPGESLFRDFLTRPGAVTMSRSTADEFGLQLGQDLAVSASGRSYSATLIGTFGEDGDTGLQNLLVTDIATAQVWLDSIGRLTRIDARIPDGDDAALARFEAALPDGLRILSAAGRTRTTAEMSAAFMTNLAAMSLLALLVGLFLIYNSVSFSVLQRRSLIGNLRALGVTRGRMLSLILVEAAVVGSVASILGVVTGILLGDRLLVLVSQSINDLYFRLNVTDVMVSPFSIAKGLAAGIGASLAAAAVPAIEAMSFPPRLTMMRSSLEGRTGRLLPRVALAGMLTMLAAVAVLILSGRNLVAGLIAMFLLIFGFALCVPLAVKVASAVLAPLASRIGGMLARMAVSGIGESLSRTGVAIVALAVAVSATIGVSVMVDSFRGSVDEWLQRTLQADVYAGVQRGSLDPGLLGDIVSLDGVGSSSTSRRVQLEDAAGRTQLIVIRMAPGGYAGTEIIDANPDDVWPAWERDDVVLVSEPYAYQHEVSRGDIVQLPTDRGPHSFVIAAIYQSYDINASAMLMSRVVYDRHFDDDGVDSVGLYLSGGVDPEAIMARIGEISEGRQEIRFNSNARIRELSLEIFDRTFIITDVLYWLAVGVAFIGILGAMLALQLERGRELAVLRALGMTPWQLGGLITTQTAMIGLLSGVAAVPLGIMMAYVLIEVINRRAFGWQIDMSVAPDILLSAIAFAVGAALLAGIYPSFRAARSQPAAAMREE
ncbi:MAG: FtsX-like permease family protein [Gammaproteobacteria bacterium]|jgi:putative ABC transport system permease protein|nr:FtsX-like permease family protein [Gammaproteobacteria bacterium]MDH3846186.1 FtsX-like permease family protein [Gammaproteobacteria bacterium]MDH3862456.1 FtsX-like permease family protein [Gammaproteobacteria bacterium]MDH3953619.1 FtsX-like permease family protein [Gammaproteobacteria bacterium]MDH4003496.1 FtsX-like permease family protein [Gammaproteobacteria bacterium]